MSAANGVQRGNRPVENTDDGERRSAGRVPPHNLEAEESLVGAMLLSKDAIASAVEIGLTAADFYKPALGHMFEAAIALYSQGEPVDTVTLTDELRRASLLEGVGGQPAIVALEANTPSIGNAARYARIVAEHALLRRLIAAGGRLADLGYELPADVSEALEEAERVVFGLRRDGELPASFTYETAAGEFLDDLEARCASGGVVQLSTGWPDLDEFTAGLHPSELTILGGRTGMGKSSLAIALVGNVARAGVPTLVVSIEMGYKELAGRAIVSEARVDGAMVRLGRLSENDLSRIGLAAAKVAALPVEISDASTATLMTVRATARRMAARRGLGLVVVDYLQLMAGRKGAENRQVEVAELAQGLKILARELKVPVIALAQLSRALEGRAEKRPTLADLRESGNIENSADTVLFVYRDEYYKQDSPDLGVAEVIVAKQRNGPLGTVRLAADMRYGTWLSLSRKAMV